MRILLVEDSLSLSDTLVTVLQREGYEVQCAYDGDEGLDFAQSKIYDLILLDVMMPKRNGLMVLQALRKQKINTPVIILTALSQESNKVQGLDLGADDYIAKPFSTPELLARIRALLRRRGGDLINENLLSYGNVTLNLASYELSTHEKSIKLSQKEFEIMRYFFENPKFVAEKNALINKVWGLENDFESNSLEVFISFLRKKIIFIGANFGINTVRGVGYQLGLKI